MTRKKVKLAWIANNNTRRLSLKNRTSGLMKKVSELTILCDVNACIIIYIPNQKEPVVWPSNARVQEALARFQTMSEFGKLKKTKSQETYLEEMIVKTREQLAKQMMRDKEVEMNQLMHQIHETEGHDELDLYLDELQGLTWFMQWKMEGIRKQIDNFEKVPFAFGTNHQNHPFSSAEESAQIDGMGLADHRFVGPCGGNE